MVKNTYECRDYESVDKILTSLSLTRSRKTTKKEIEAAKG